MNFVLNGALVEWAEPTISYEQVVSLAALEGVSVAWNSPSSGEAGTLGPGELVTIQPDTVISAVASVMGA